MNKSFSALFIFFSFFCLNAQTKNTIVVSKIENSSVPVFQECKNTNVNSLEDCFFESVQQLVYENFRQPENLKPNYKSTIKVLFEVNTSGEFKVLYVNAADAVLKDETYRVFEQFPKVTPATFDGRAVYSKYTVTIAIPLISPEAAAAQAKIQAEILQPKSKPMTELDSIVLKKYNNPEFQSHLNIPFSHSYYAQFDAAMNQVGSNNHTASKPYTYKEVAKYYDFVTVNANLKKDVSTWFGRKLWNENLVEIQGENYWFSLNPLLDLQMGKATQNDASTYLNTRALNFRGGLGKQINFTTTVFESQGRFAEYFNRYAESIKPSGGNPAIIPGMGIGKRFKEDGYDFPLAEANLTFSPSNFFDLQLGYGRNFIGDGYRSLLESDGASPYPYFKINSTFWKIKYTNTYMWLKDVRPDVTVDKTYATKFAANHYLSLNVSNRLNLGFFESVIWTDSNGRGFDMNFVNPIIFYRSVEFSSSSRSGNAMLGFTSKYKWNNSVNLYGQFLLDEFSVGDMAAGERSWKNKFGYQFGLKYFNAFQVKDLLLQLEYNHVRPYVYQHSAVITNYGHNNQSLGHQWGGNFEELVAVGRYHRGRIFADAKINYGVRGLDFDSSTNTFNYGSNPYKSYEDSRPYDKGVKIGQGNKTNVFIADLQSGYLVNPATNLKLYASYIYRNFDPTQNTVTAFKESTNWFSIGIRSDIFNWYFDY